MDRKIKTEVSIARKKHGLMPFVGDGSLNHTSSIFIYATADHSQKLKMEKLKQH